MNMPGLPESKFSPTRVLIVGISSYIGSALALGLRDHYEVFGTTHKSPFRMDGCVTFALNVTEGGEITDVLQNISPDVIIYCAGIRDAAFSENYPAVADAVNAKAPSIFFKLLRSKMHFIYFAEDRFLDARNLEPGSAIEETFVPTVTFQSSALAKTKIAGENVVRAHKHNTHIFRLGSLYGENLGTIYQPRINWLSSLISQMQNHQPVSALSDTQRTFVYIGDVVRALRLFISSLPTQSGTYHLSHDSHTYSHFDLIEMVCKSFRFESELLEQRPYSLVHMADWGPQQIELSSKVFSQTYNFQFQSPSEALAELTERYKRGFFNNWS